MTDSMIFEVNNVSKSFLVGGEQVAILKRVNVKVEKGDFLIIFGPSGCGKSTLLHGLLGLEAPTTGFINFMGKDMYVRTTATRVAVSNEDVSSKAKLDVKAPKIVVNNMISEDDRSEMRKKYMGMVYQQPNWIKSLSVIENVAFPLQLLGKPKIESLAVAAEILATVGMTERANYIPSELSSGQQQRIALARALVSNPQVIIADEPTGNLDYEAGQNLMKLLTDLNTRLGTTILMVTHDLEYLKYAKTAIKMFNGEVVGNYDKNNKSELLTEIKSKRGVGHA